MRLKGCYRKEEVQEQIERGANDGPNKRLAKNWQHEKKEKHKTVLI